MRAFIAAWLPIAMAAPHRMTGCWPVVLPPVAADFDHDDDVDLEDFARFQLCFAGPNRPPTLPADCDAVDFDGDGDIDLTDFGMFQGCFNGPNRPPSAACDG